MISQCKANCLILAFGILQIPVFADGAAILQYGYEICRGDNSEVFVESIITILDSGANHNRCTFKFRKEPDFCHIRLDFMNVNSENANENGTCETDRITVSNTTTVNNDFTTCGSNLAGQHMYLAFGWNDVIQVSSQMRSVGARYTLVATKVPCESRIPDHCLQYFDGISGRVTSFDYGNQQQSSQSYSVCVKPVPQSSQIAWNVCADAVEKPFDIISNIMSDQIKGDHCTTDWVQVKGRPRQCELFDPQPQTSSWKPYELMVNFDHQEIPPPPPPATIPVDPNNCPAQCALYHNLPNYECSCVAVGNNNSTGGQACLCLQVMPAPIPGVPPVSVDFANTGFCLEYNQQ